MMRLNPYALDAAAEIVGQCRLSPESRARKEDAARIVRAYLRAVREHRPSAERLARALLRDDAGRTALATDTGTGGGGNG
jgi:hypothetical protein